jgi:hypothetical protein
LLLGENLKKKRWTIREWRRDWEQGKGRRRAREVIVKA